MNRNLSIVLVVFSIMYFGALIVSSIETPSVDETVEQSVIGTTVTSEDGTHCWTVEEKIDVYYYKLTECSGNA